MNSELTRRLLRFTSAPQDPPTVFEGGSSARGWANKHSDRDFYAILAAVDDPAPGGDVRRVSCAVAPGCAYRSPVYTDGGIVDIQIWSSAQVMSLIAAMSADQVGSPTLASALTFAEVEFLGRLWHGVPISGESQVRQWQRRLHESDARRVMAARCLRLADNAIEDAIGQWDEGDLRSATMAAARAYGAAVDAVLAIAGEFSFSSKWRVRRLEHVRPRQLSADDYWVVETMYGYHDDPEAWLERVLGDCQTLAASVEL